MDRAISVYCSSEMLDLPVGAGGSGSGESSQLQGI